MRWLLIILTGLAFLLSACGKTGSGEKLAVVNWDKVLKAHPQYEILHKKQEEYNLLLDRRKEQEIIGKTQMSGLAKLNQLKQHSKQNYLSADFLTRMTEKQTAEQQKLKQLSNRIAAEVDKELAEEEKKMNEHYRLQIFNLRLKLDTVRMIPEQRKKVEAELHAVQAARDQDRMLLAQHKMSIVTRRMQPHVEEVHRKLDAYARQLQSRMLEELKKSRAKDSSALQAVPDALKELLNTVDQELDKRQQDIEVLETSIRKDMESAVLKLAKERHYSVVFHKYRVNISADDITGDVIATLKKQAALSQAANALSQKVSGSGANKGN